MSIPIQGQYGKVTQGTADTALVFIESWDGDINQAIDEQGPFLNDGGALYANPGALSVKGSMKGIVPSGKDASQTAILAAIMAGTNLKVGLMSIGGYSVVVANAIIESVKLGHDAKKGATFEASFRNNGAFTAA